MALSFAFDRELRPAAAHRLFNISDGDTLSIVQPVGGLCGGTGRGLGTRG
jgi:hypothetical protein